MGKALYRKYRARTLSEIVGQDHIVTPLANSLKSHKISHAYLLTGPRGTGKTSVARILAHEINNFPYELEDSYIDIIEIDAASNTGVDNIRDIREKAIIAPTQGKYKIYIIDEVHMLSKSAFNALLKTLEEPPEHVIFIMATTDPQKVPVTILSRAQQYQFKFADLDTIIAHLRSISDAEQIQITDDALATIAKRGGGSFRDSISLLDQLSTITTDQITRDIIEKSLGLPSDQLISSLIDAYIIKDLTSIHQNLSALVANGVKPEIIAEELIAKIISAPTGNIIPLLSYLVDVARSSHPQAQLLLALLKDLPLSTPTPTTEAPLPTSSPTSEMSLSTPDPTPKTPVSAPTPAPTTPKKPTPAPVTTFNWADLLDNITKSAPTISSAIRTSTYSVDGDLLKITPSNKVNYNHLSKPAKQAQITSLLPPKISLKILPPEKTLKNQASTADSISAIMGEVTEINIEEVF